jgi:NitT/TauT family transport system substrate-binding protein
MTGAGKPDIDLLLSRRQLLKAGMLLGAGYVIAACGGASSVAPSASASSGAVSMTRITLIEGGHALGWMPAYLALNNGDFRKAGLDVDYQTSAQGTTTAIAAVTNGSAFMVLSGSPPHLTAIAKGAPLRMVAVIANVYGTEITVTNALMSKKNITVKAALADKLAALKGAKIGIYNPGDSTDQFMRFMFKTHAPQINPESDLQLVPLQTAANMLAAYSRGTIDGMAVSGPTGEQAVALGGATVFVKASESPKLKNFPYSVISCNTDDLKNRADLIKNTIKVLASEFAVFKKNPAIAKPFVAQSMTGFSSQVFDLGYENALEGVPTTPVLSKAQFEQMINFQATLGNKMTLSYEQMVDPGPATKAAKELGI